MKNALLSLSICMLFSCTRPQSEEKPTVSTFDFEEAKREIQEITVRFGEAHVNKDTAFLNNIVTENVLSFPPGSAPASGREAITQLNWEWVNYGIYRFTEKSTRTYGSQDYIVDEGTYYLVYGPDSTRESGNYLNVWKKEENEWKMHSNIWNTTTTE